MNRIAMGIFGAAFLLGVVVVSGAGVMAQTANPAPPSGPSASQRATPRIDAAETNNSLFDGENDTAFAEINNSTGVLAGMAYLLQTREGVLLQIDAVTMRSGPYLITLNKDRCDSPDFGIVGGEVPPEPNMPILDVGPIASFQHRFEKLIPKVMLRDLTARGGAIVFHAGPNAGNASPSNATATSVGCGNWLRG